MKVKHVFVTLALVSLSTQLIGCNRNANSIPNQPNLAVPGNNNLATTPTPSYTDPMAGGANYTTPTNTGMYDPNNPYGSTTGTGYGMPTTGAGYGAGYGAPTTGYGTTPMIDPMTGQPMAGYGGLNPQMDRGVTTQIVAKINSAGGPSSSKSDDIIRSALKGVNMMETIGNSPYEHRAMMIKCLLTGWVTGDDKTLAQQIWATVMPQEQQRLLGQDSELNKVVTKQIGGGTATAGASSGGGLFAGIAKLFGAKQVQS